MTLKSNRENDPRAKLIQLTAGLKADAEVLKMTLYGFNEGLKSIKKIIRPDLKATYESYPVLSLETSSDNSVGHDAMVGASALFCLMPHALTPTAMSLSMTQKNVVDEF